MFLSFCLEINDIYLRGLFCRLNDILDINLKDILFIIIVILFSLGKI